MNKKLITRMLEEFLVINHGVKDSFHFQIVPLYLSLVGKDSILPAQGTTYRFLVQKGHHKFDQNRHPIQAHFSSIEGVPTMPVSACRLNFYIPNYIKLKRHDFILKMIQRECNQDFQIGEYFIDAGTLIQQFKTKQLKRHEITTFFSAEYELDFQIYIEQSRADLQRLVQESEAERKLKMPKARRNDVDNAEKVQEEDGKNGEQMKISSGSASEYQHEYTAPQKEVKEKIHSQESYTFGEEQRPKKLFRMFSKDQPNNNNQVLQNSESSINKVPLIQTKFKQLAKADTPFEIRMTESERLSELVISSLTDDSASETFKRKKLFLWLYIIVMMLITFLVMHPAKKL